MDPPVCSADDKQTIFVVIGALKVRESQFLLISRTYSLELFISYLTY